MQKKLIVKIETFIIIKMLVIIKMPIKTEIIKIEIIKSINKKSFRKS